MSGHDAEMSRQQQARREEVARNDRALLQAARRVFSRDGAHASVSSIAEAAGVGVGTLYRRYESKTALFERLLVLANEQWADAVSRAHSAADPWTGLSTLVVESIEYGQGTLSALGRLVHVPARLNALMTRADEEFHELIDRAHADGGLAADVTAADVLLLIEQYARSPLVEQITDLDDPELLKSARTTRRRLITIALNGLRRREHEALPAPAPTSTLLTARWTGPDRSST
ncbi:TetR/AcrR family transcriptional regulator [Nocardiopsis alba]|uniref:TetR/AcrR family transcriptional regulator n=1 Tax=Nocardiopsis alba TaxID=53437 RepID=UPI0033FF2841